MLLNMTTCADVGCSSDCKTYVLPLSECYSPALLFPGDRQWGSADVLDTAVNHTHLHRLFFNSSDGSCSAQTGDFLLPLATCVGPFGKPRPWGAFTIEGDDDDDVALCRAHVASHAADVRRPAKGALAHPYLVPSGPYEQLWDWDAVFLGVATLRLGNGPYLAGSMRNFFEATNVSTGAVTGCLTTSKPVVCSASPSQHDALVHAKPILIQGACGSECASHSTPRTTLH